MKYIIAFAVSSLFGASMIITFFKGLDYAKDMSDDSVLPMFFMTVLTTLCFLGMLFGITILEYPW